MDIDWAVVSAALSAVAAIAAAVAAFRIPLSAERLAAALQTVAADRERKLDLLRRVAGYRSMPPTSDWMNALNEIAITFNDRKAVINALRTFEQHVRTNGGHSNDDLLRLLSAMITEVGLSREGLDDEFLLRPFSANIPSESS